MSFALAAARAFQVDASSSSAKFTSDAQLSTIVGKTKKLSGMVKVDPENLQTAAGLVAVDLASIKTGNSLRDKHMRENFLQTSRFPEAKFELKPGGIKGKALVKGSNSLNLTGTFSVHGVSKTKSVTAIITYDPDTSTLSLKCHFSLLLSDYNIERPSMLAVRVSDEALIDITVVMK